MTLEESLLRQLIGRGLTVASAESCTGGLICQRLTALPGASRAVLGGCVTYTNDMKQALLGVSPDTLAVHTAVSRETALEMAAGVCRVTGADLGLAVTGYAGPGEGAGTIWAAACFHGTTAAGLLPRHFGQDRAKNRMAAADWALELGLRLLKGEAYGTL